MTNNAAKITMKTKIQTVFHLFNVKNYKFQTEK